MPVFGLFSRVMDIGICCALNWECGGSNGFQLRQLPPAISQFRLCAGREAISYGSRGEGVEVEAEQFG